MTPELDGPRPPTPKEIPGVLEFLKTSLRPEKTWDFGQEYPLVFQNSNLNNLRIIKKGEEVLCHAAVKPLFMKTPWGLIKVAGIGSVVTKENYRKQGLSAQTINSCLETAYLLGCEIGILWTDLYDFYSKLGFELAGSELHLRITERFQPPQWQDFKVLKGNQVDPNALMRLAGAHRVSSLRKEAEIRSHLSIPNSTVYTSWNKHGALSAYAVEGKGADLEAHIHEWGGGVKALAALVRHMREDQERDLVFLSPRHSENLVSQFETFGAQRSDGYLGMMKLLHTDRLFEKIKQYARSLGVPLVLERQEDRTLMGLEGELIELTDDADLVKIFFGPLRPAEFSVWSSSVSLELNKVFPLPFWIWGWDSV